MLASSPPMAPLQQPRVRVCVCACILFVFSVCVSACMAFSLAPAPALPAPTRPLPAFVGRACAFGDLKKPSPQDRGSTACSAYNFTFGDTSGDNRVALVTGASRGIGKAIALALAQGGCKHLLLVARNQGACEATAAEFRSMGFSASGHGVDVSDAPAVKELVCELLQRHKHIDILVNNAGITKDNIYIRMSNEEWNDVINVNLNSAHYFTQPIIQKMIKHKFGRIINTSSVVGVSGNAGQANYAASKAGLIGFTKSLAKEYAHKGITANAIAPGFIKTQMTQSLSPEVMEMYLKQIPAGRMGTAEEIASLAVFLASDQAGYINGKVINIDGGLII